MHLCFEKWPLHNENEEFSKNLHVSPCPGLMCMSVLVWVLKPMFSFGSQINMIKKRKLIFILFSELGGTKTITKNL